MPDPLPPLLDARLVIVTGKGGTGKTTVAAALALAAARAGRRVLLAEVGRDEQAAALVRPGVGPVGYAGREVAPGLRAMRLDPFDALADYLGLQLGSFVAERVVRNRAFQQLMGATPGWRELIALGAIWHFERGRERDGRPTVDLIVVDAPATGHGLTFLDVPHVVASAVRTGPLRRNAAEVERLLADPRRTRLLPVALAEELPVRETAELVGRLRSERQIAVDRIVVNAVEARPLPASLESLPDALDALAASEAGARAGAPSAPPPGVLARCIRHRVARRALHERQLAMLGELVQLPVVVLPFLPGAVRGPDDLAALAPHLLAAPVDARDAARDAHPAPGGEAVA
ncbi:MAG: ArsA-related P-loop ATPase [Myxococcota bacterium]